MASAASPISTNRLSPVDRLSPVTVQNLNSRNIVTENNVLSEGPIFLIANSVTINHLIINAKGNITIEAAADINNIAGLILAPQGTITLTSEKGCVNRGHFFEGRKFEIYKEDADTFTELSYTIRQYILDNEELLSFGIDYSETFLHKLVRNIFA